MIEISENILELNPGDEFPEGAQDALKIYLTGSVDSGQDGSTYDWQRKFITGLETLTNQKDGLIMLKNQRFVIFNPKYNAANPLPDLSNPEFVAKKSWELDMMEMSDGIFCNFLKKSTSYLPMFYFGLLSGSQKMVVRCPEEYINYSHVRFMCERLNIPLLPGKTGTVLSVIQSFYSYVPKFQEVQNLKLPE